MRFSIKDIRMKHVNDKFMVVSVEKGILKLAWKDATKELTDKLFKVEAKKFTEVLEKTKNKRILVDMRKFNYNLRKEMIKWRSENVIKVYNKLGVKRFAFISEKPAVKQDSPKNTFITETFSLEDEALQWLLS